MTTKIYCDIMNRIQKLAKENGEADLNVLVTIKLLNGDKFQAERGEIILRDGYIEALTNNDSFIFVPIENIVSINV